MSVLAASVSLPLLALAPPARAAVTVGTNVSVFPDRDMVVAVGYQLGEDLTIEVLRGGVVIGTTTGPAVETPEGVGLEVNHGPLGAPLPGDCWTGFTPDIVGGDVVRVTNSAGAVDTMTVEDVAFVGKPYLDASNNVAVDGTGVQGQSDFAVEFRRDKPDPRFRQGPFAPVWTSPTTWTATWRVGTTNVSGLTPAQQRTIALNEASWLAVADITTETTLAELGEPGGVGPGCTGSADPNNVVDPKPVNLASGDFTLTGTARSGVAAVNITVGDLAPKAATLSTNATGTKTWSLPVTKAELASQPDGYVTIGSSFVGAATTDEAGAEVPGVAIAGADVLMLKDTSAPAAPTASPDSGTYGGAQAVTLDKGDDEDGSKIRYRLGSSTVLDPTATSTEATGQISVTASQTLKARVFDVAGNPGAVGTFTYRIGTPPATPTGLTAAEAQGGIRLGWTAVGGATGYNVYRDGGTTPVNATPVAGTAYTDAGVANGAHSYAVKAVEANGIESAASTAASATLAPPAVPRGLNATPGNGQNALSWTRNTEADLASYELVRDGRTPVSVAETQGGYTDTGLTNGTLYGYSLVAVDDAGNRSAASGTVQATPVAPAPVVTAPGAPTGAAATAGNASAAVRWTAPASNGGSAITGYSVRTYSGTTLVRTTPVGNVTSATIGTLTNGTAYTFDVAATNAVGTSGFSTRSAAVTPVAAPTNTAPTVTTRTPASGATGVAVGSNVTATFSEDVQGVSGTTVFLRQNGSTTNIGATVGYNATTRVATLDPTANLAAGTSYTATLTGGTTAIRDTANLGMTTTSWSFTTAAAAPTGTVPGAPTIGTAASGTAGSPITAAAAWTAPTSVGSSAITGYRVTATQTDSAGVVIANGARITSATLPATARNFTMTFTTVPAETSFRFTVVALNAAGSSAQSAQSNRVTAR